MELCADVEQLPSRNSRGVAALPGADGPHLDRALAERRLGELVSSRRSRSPLKARTNNVGGPPPPFYNSCFFALARSLCRWRRALHLACLSAARRRPAPAAFGGGAAARLVRSRWRRRRPRTRASRSARHLPRERADESEHALPASLLVIADERVDGREVRGGHESSSLSEADDDASLSLDDDMFLRRRGTRACLQLAHKWESTALAAAVCELCRCPVLRVLVSSHPLCSSRDEPCKSCVRFALGTGAGALQLCRPADCLISLACRTDFGCDRCTRRIAQNKRLRKPTRSGTYVHPAVLWRVQPNNGDSAPATAHQVYQQELRAQTPSPRRCIDRAHRNGTPPPPPPTDGRSGLPQKRFFRSRALQPAEPQRRRAVPSKTIGARLGGTLPGARRQQWFKHRIPGRGLRVWRFGGGVIDTSPNKAHARVRNKTEGRRVREKKD